MRDAGNVHDTFNMKAWKEDIMGIPKE